MNARPVAEESQKPLIIPPFYVIKHEPMFGEHFFYSRHCGLTVVG